MFQILTEVEITIVCLIVIASTTIGGYQFLRYKIKGPNHNGKSH